MSANAMAEVSRLRDHREAAGISQQELAHRAGCSIAMVRLLESGYHPSKSDVLARIVAALKADEAATHGLVAKTRDAGARHDRA